MSRTIGPADQSNQAMHIVPLVQAGLSPVEHVGAKANALGILKAHGVNVPNGFVIRVSCFNEFCEINRVEINHVMHGSECLQLSEYLLFLQNKILAGQLSDCFLNELFNNVKRLGDVGRFAVRSSAFSEDGADSSWAGILTTVLNVSVEELAHSIQVCWASVFNPAIEFYLRNRSLNAELGTAVIIQEMIIFDVSGVIFSADPRSNDTGKIVIEVVEGACENLVAGKMTPDRYVIGKNALQIVERHVGQGGRAKISFENMMQLADIALRLETLMGGHVDIEWGIGNGKLYILQCRPITTLQPLTPERQAACGNYNFWWSDCEAYWEIESRARILETMPWIPWNRVGDLVLYTEYGITKAYISEQDVAAEVVRGNVFLHASTVPEYRDLLHDLLSSFDAFKEDCSNMNLSNMTENELLDVFSRALCLFKLLVSYYKSTGPNVTALFTDEVGYHLSYSEIDRLDQSCREEDIVNECRDFVHLLSATQENLDSLIGVHLSKYPWLSLNSYTYESARNLLLSRVWNWKKISKGKDSLKKGAGVITSEKNALPSAYHDMFFLIKSFRTKIKLCWASFDFLMMPFFAEVCRRGNESVFDVCRYYRIEEIESLISKRLKVAQDTKAYRAIAHLTLFAGGRICQYEGVEAREAFDHLSIENPKESTIVGSVSCHGNMGRLTGRALLVVCNDPVSVILARSKIQSGDILITSMTQFNTLDLVGRACGLVTDEGGILCHASIIAREFSMPCIVGTKNATSLIKEGDIITMDLHDGSVVIERRERE
ncbi:PEP/pyruvate-binding domain-containing protein [Pseudomonas marginalis]|uniref:PEP/pyruvate-binding domain-containing protein n=1 Tax=Pseudomonas marginalis TaxID=298 RepID=UPI003B9F3B0A